MEKLQIQDQKRTLHNEPHCSYVTRNDQGITRSRQRRRIFSFWGSKKTKIQAQNLTSVAVQESKHEEAISDDLPLDFIFTGGEVPRKSQEEIKAWAPVGLEVVNELETGELMLQPSPEKKSTPELKASTDSVTSTEGSSTSGLIVVDDSRCDTSWEPPGFQTGLERINSLLNSLHEDESSVESQHTSRSTSNVIPSASATAEDLEKTLKAHIARERQASAALSFNSYVKEITEWKGGLSLRTDSTESLPGWLPGPSASLECADDSNLQSTGFASNVHLLGSVLPEDGVEEEELLEPEEDAVPAEPDDEPVSEVVVSSASLQASLRSPSKCWKFNVDAATSTQLTSVLPKAEVSTETAPVVSHLMASEVTHVNELGLPLKRNAVRVKWGGGWVPSTNMENSSTNAVSPMSFTSQSGPASSPGLSLSASDNLSTRTFSEELDFHLPRHEAGHKDTEAVQKLTQILEDLSTDEQPWVRVSYAQI